MRDPSACRHCGIPEAQHLQRWTSSAGWHVWTEPTKEQRYAAMRANAAERQAQRES